LAGLERALGVAAPARAPQAALALKELYDGDAVEEEAMLAWRANEKAAAALGVPPDAAAAVRAGAAPFLTWLEEADSDDDGSSE
jgi:translation initiation factor 5